jgi:hypothetical protein
VIRFPFLRFRRVDDTPASDEFETLQSDEETEQPEAPNRRPIIIAVIAFVIGCILLAACLLIYSFTRGQPSATLTPTVAVVAATETTAPTQAATATPTEEQVIAQPTDDLTATALAALPPVRYATLSEIVGEVQTRPSPAEAWSPANPDLPIAPGTTVLTGQNSRVKITLAEGNIIRLSSQTQFTLLQADGSDSDPIDRMQLEFGKLWAIVIAPLNSGVFEIQLPVGVAAVRGSFLSAEYNSTTNGIVVSCLEGQCHYENDKGVADFTTQQQAVSVGGAAPNIVPISSYQLSDWAIANVPEVQTLTPPPTETPIPSETPIATPTRTPTPSRTPIPSRTPVPSRTPTETFTPRPTSSMTSTPTNTFTPSATATPGTPARLIFSLQPVNAPIGNAFKVAVAIQDAAGNTLPDATNAVSLAIGANGGGGTLAGATTVGPVNGIATFTVSIDKPGSYTLVASANGLEGVTSAAFDVFGSKALLFIISGLPNEITNGQTVVVSVTAVEANGNVAKDYLGTVRFQSSDNQATLPVDYTFTPADQGAHTFTIVFRTAGSQTLKVFDTFIPALAGYAGTNVK